MIARNLQGFRIGQHHQNAKLTDEEVREMRYLRQLDKKQWSYKKLAEKFSCGESTVRDIVRYFTRYNA